MPANLENSAVAQDWKRSVFIPIPKKDNAKEYSNYHTAAAAAKSLQSCPTLCDPIDGSPPGSPVPGILQARTHRRTIQKKIIMIQITTMV